MQRVVVAFDMGRRPPVPAFVAALCAACVFFSWSSRIRGDEPLIRSGTAFVTQDEQGRGWVIGNDLIRYSFGQVGGSIGVRAIEDPVNDREWHRGNDPDSFFTLNGQRVAIGSPATTFVRASVNEWWGGVALDVTYRIDTVPMEVTRSYVCYPNSSIIETWTTFQTIGSRSATLSDVTNFSIALENGNLRWIRGLGVPDDEGGPFILESGDLDDGQTFEIGSTRRATETSMPWLGVSAWTEEAEQSQPEAVRSHTQFFGLMLWSGSWRGSARRQGDAVTVQFGLPSFSLTLAAGATLESPHAVFGTTSQLVPTPSLAMQSFIENGIRHGRPLRALVTYNTWYSYGVAINEASLRAEMELAAQMGFEQFVVDAGWWGRSREPDDNGDFVHDWGNWEVDRDRFPAGLGALTDRAHELGMRFGVWVEPERVDRSTVGQPGLAKERFLATDRGRYDPSVPNNEAVSSQICLVDPEARQWVLSKLYEFLDDVHPDYLKWDNNFWVNCDRPNHGHGPGDGNFQHMRALHEVLADLRERYPDMDIENCASGGNRMSLDMLAYTDTAWVDDRTAPSNHVRHNLEGLAWLMPPAYLFSFAMAGEEEPMYDDPPLRDLSVLMRSRMSSVLGGTWLAGDMNDVTRLQIGRQLALYKLVRPILQRGGSVLLSHQLVEYPGIQWSGWDVVEHLSRPSGEAVVFAFNSRDGEPSAIVKPRGLRADADYDVESADFGPLGTVKGEELMLRGVQVDQSGVTRSHVLIFRIHRDLYQH